MRVALHVNPFAYHGKTGSASKHADEDTYNAAMVGACREAGVDAIAITDHYDVSSSRSLRTAAEARGIHVFPGFEAQTSEGVHLLVLFDPGTPESVVQSAIGACGVVRDASHSPIGNIDVAVLTRRARHEWGAICIAAHATTTGKGILRGVQGQPRMRAWQSADLLAAAIPGPVDALNESDRLIVENKTEEYRRARPMTLINARDVKAPEDVADPASTTLVKMSEITVEALRQAFLDPTSRIRLNSDAPSEGHTQFTRLSWEGGFLDGVVIDLNDNLNVLIGGRGAGKSCVIESIRYVLEQVPAGPEAKTLHDSIVRQVLGAGTKITLHMRVHGPTPREYVVERTVNNPANVRDTSGKVLAVRPRDLFRRIEIYGQHEISELTKDPALLTQLLDRFTSLEQRSVTRRVEVERLVAENRAEVMRLRTQLTEVDERLRALPALEEQLRSYESVGLEDKFKERSALIPEEPIFKGFTARIAKARAAVSAMGAAVETGLRSLLKEPEVERLPHADLVREADGLVGALSVALLDLGRHAEDLISETERKLQPLLDGWQRDRDGVEERFSGLLRALGAQKVDAQMFIALRQQIEELRGLAQERTVPDEQLAAAMASRRGLLAELEDLRAAQLRALTSAAEQVSRALSGVVRVQVAGGQQRAALEAHLREELGGTLKQTLEQLKGVPDLSVRELAATITEGPDALRKRYGLTSAQSEHLARLPDEARLALEELHLGPITRIDLNVRPDAPTPQWQPLADLSTGQKATAILLLLLLEGDTPLVVDQPEDDLDNRFISEKIVPKIKTEKQRRQFVFSSHNANIPVLGDAELIIGLQGSADAATVSPDHLGSIDRRSIRDLASQVLEGGRDAFDLRREKYDF